MTTTEPIRAALDGIRERSELAELFATSVFGRAVKQSQADVAPMLAALEAVLNVCERHAAGSWGEQMVVAEVRGAITYQTIVRRTDR